MSEPNDLEAFHQKMMGDPVYAEAYAEEVRREKVIEGAQEWLQEWFEYGGPVEPLPLMAFAHTHIRDLLALATHDSSPKETG